MSRQGKGLVPAVALWDPKFSRNVGMTHRVCAAFGVPQLWYTGDRAESDWHSGRRGRQRLPREERLRDYRSCEVIKGEGRFLDQFPPGTVPVAVEVHPGAEVLTFFQHPEHAVYVFGPEDGSLPRGILEPCHRIVVIPSDHCLNLATAVTTVLAHRRMQRQVAGLEEVRPAAEMMLEPRG